MAIELWLTFLAASALMLVIPGPTIITVIAYATANGKPSILPLVAAVSLGDLTVISLSVFGLGSLLAISSTAFTVVKITGGMYLLYLGIKMIRSAGKRSNRPSAITIGQQSNMFFNAWLVTALNPKGIIFFGAFLPQFIQTQRPIAPQLAVLTATFICLAALNTLAYAVMATRASHMLSSVSTNRRFEMGGGIAMSAAGLWALTARQN